MNDCVLIGAGGYAVSLLDILNEQSIQILGYVANAKSNSLDFKKIEDLDSVMTINQSVSLINAIGISGGVNVRARVFCELSSQGFKFLNLISNFACISPHASLADGVHVFPGAVVECDVSLMENVVINVNSSVHHGVSVGKHSFIAPGARLLGDSKIGEKTLIGSNAIIAPGVHIGNNCKIAAGSFVRFSLADGERNY
ncbi:MAG: hypothetical protein RL589_48 [Actinomycetota bacterium]|jgi:UDP-perosamine 4-acetyltransferase